MAAAKKAPAKKATAPKAPKAAKKAPAKKATAPKAEKAPKDTQNGVVRPKAGTTSASVFDIADSLSKSTKAPAVRKDVIEAAEKDGINKATAATQYARWRVFNGLAPAIAA